MGVAGEHDGCRRVVDLQVPDEEFQLLLTLLLLRRLGVMAHHDELLAQVLRRWVCPRHHCHRVDGVEVLVEGPEVLEFRRAECDGDSLVLSGWRPDHSEPLRGNVHSGVEPGLGEDSDVDSAVLEDFVHLLPLLGHVDAPHVEVENPYGGRGIVGFLHDLDRRFHEARNGCPASLYTGGLATGPSPLPGGN